MGALTFGTEMGFGSNKKECRRIFDVYVDRGGNFLDTANFYTEGTSESYLGEFSKGKRDSLVIGTKYSISIRSGDPNAGGNHRKSMMQAVEGSLKRLKTDYIDLYWLHIWDSITPIHEVMRAFDDLVRAGKVLYIGISDTPAWKVAQANTLAEIRGLSRFVGLQILYNLIERTAERELIPMAEELKLGLTPWSPLAAGMLTGKYNPEREQHSNTDNSMLRNVSEQMKTDRNLRIAKSVVQVANKIGHSPAQVALNWLLQKPRSAESDHRCSHNWTTRGQSRRFGFHTGKRLNAGTRRCELD